MNIIGTGLSGLVGSRVVELLSSSYSFTNLSLETGIDITDAQTVDKHIIPFKGEWVLHFAAMTDVDKAETDRALGKEGKTWQVNVLATQYIVEACKKSGKRLLYISTDFVFDGNKPCYTEEDTPNPQGWYAVTKYEGEKLVHSLGDRGLIVRIANPYRAFFPAKPDFVHKIAQRLRSGEELVAPNDQQFIPTFIDDIAVAIKTLLSQSASGIYHVVGSQALSPFEAAQRIASFFHIPNARITSTSFAEYFASRAPRPFQAILKHDKISEFGVSMSSFDEGLIAIGQQLKDKGVSI